MATPNASRMQAWRGAPTPGAAPVSPSKSPARRVLGDLTPNARNTPAKPKGVEYAKTKETGAASLLKENVAFADMAAGGTKLESKSQPTVNPRKRSIQEVDGAAVREGPDGRLQRRSINEHGAGRAMVYQHAVSTQQRRGLQRLESTQSLSSTDADSPEPTAPASQDTHASKASFSSLIEYNPAVSPSEPPHPSSSPPAVTDSAAAKSQADTLRLRLRIAMYKVRTNQTAVPLSRLRVAPPQQSSSARQSPQPATTSSTATTTITTTTITTTTTLPSAPSSSPQRRAQSAPSPTKSSSQPQLIPSIVISSRSPSPSAGAANPSAAVQAVPKLLPAPVLVPTAFSSRHITEAYHVPSSPPEPLEEAGNRDASPRVGRVAQGA